ncbi:hypothetical protein DVJ78_07990 [Humibacter sp. BT305]|nr:hypothetical protein DVJ78_07990 [Humibacter sp. BT305]
MSAAGGFELGGVPLRFEDAVGAEGWVAVAAEGEPQDVLSPALLETLGRVRDRDDVQVLSPWFVFQREFGWPADAAECGCLERNGFTAVAEALNGESLVATPGVIFDRFVMRRALLDAVLETGGGTVNLADWARIVGLDTAWFAAAVPDYSPRTRTLRLALHENRHGEQHEAFARAFDSYYFGGLPTRVADEARRAYLGALEQRLGYEFGDRGDGRVIREVTTLNSVRVRTVFCHTSREVSGRKAFTSPLERLAETSTVAVAS